MIDIRKERQNHAQDRTKDASVATVKKQGAAMKHIKKYWQWYAMMLIPVVYYIVFRYIPMFGNIIAFRRYRAGSSIFGDEWSGLKYFNQFMKDQNFWRAFKNTLLLNFKYAEPVGHPHDRYRQRLDLQVCHESGRHQQRLGYLRC